MKKIALGFFLALLAVAVAYYLVAFSVFSSPVPISGEQLREIRADTAKDSHGKWVLVDRRDGEYLIYLEYPVKKYKFVVAEYEIIIRSESAQFPRNLGHASIALSTAPEDYF